MQEVDIEGRTRTEIPATPGVVTRNASNVSATAVPFAQRSSLLFMITIGHCSLVHEFCGTLECWEEDYMSTHAGGYK